MTEMLTLDAFEEASAKVQEVSRRRRGSSKALTSAANRQQSVFFKPEKHAAHRRV